MFLVSLWTIHWCTKWHLFVLHIFHWNIITPSATEMLFLFHWYQYLLMLTSNYNRFFRLAFEHLCLSSCFYALVTFYDPITFLIEYTFLFGNTEMQLQAANHVGFSAFSIKCLFHYIRCAIIQVASMCAIFTKQVTEQKYSENVAPPMTVLRENLTMEEDICSP